MVVLSLRSEAWRFYTTEAFLEDQHAVRAAEGCSSRSPTFEICLGGDVQLGALLDAPIRNSASPEMPRARPLDATLTQKDWDGFRR